MRPEDVGLIKSIETWTTIAIVLASGGSLLALLKMVPETTDGKIKKFIFQFSARSATYTSFATLAVYCFFVFICFQFHVFSSSHWYYIYALTIVPTALSQLFIRYYQATDNFKRISVINFATKAVSAVLVLSCTFYFYIAGYVYSMILASTLSFLILVWDLRTELRFTSVEILDLDKLRLKFKALAKSAFYSQILDQLKINLGFIIAFFILTDETEFGYYTFALILVQGLNVMVSSVQQFVIPKLSEVSNQKMLFFLRVKFYEKRFIGFSILIFALAELLLPYLVVFVFGEEYRDAVLLLRIMLFGWLAMIFCSINVLSFTSLGVMKYISFSSALTILFSTPIMFYLTRQYGATGAALSFVVQNVVNTFFIYYYMMKVKKQDTKKST